MQSNVNPRIVVWGELLWDRFLDGDKLGGAPANVAWHLAQLGSNVALVTRVGCDADGDRAIAQLAPHLDSSFVQRDSLRATGEVLVTLQDSEPRYQLVPGRAWEHIECNGAVAALVANAAAVVFGTLSQRAPEGLASWRKLMAGTTCLKICDPNLRPGDAALPTIAALREALEAADVIKLNDREAADCTRHFGATFVDHLIATKRLVAITHGERGSTIYSQGEAHSFAAVASMPGGDNVGCGDSFVAVLAHGLTQKWPIARIGTVASRWAAAVASRRGATPLFSDDERGAMAAAV